MKTVFFIILFMSYTSCQDQFNEQAYLDERVKQKSKEFLQKKINECKEQAHLNAVKRVDSIMVSIWSELNKYDTLEFPDKPIKPNKPNQIIDQWEDPKEKMIDSLGL